MKRKANSKIYLALLFIAIPNFNIIDLLPDFISYIILYRMINTSVTAVPYMYETRETLKRLALLTLAKLPMSLVMIANIYSGRDIIPLFTLVFGILESILLYSLVTDLFSGLFYLAERSDADAILSPIRVFGKKVSPDGVKLLTLSFFMAKIILNVIPELCLLTTSNPKLVRFANSIYIPLLILCYLVSLTIGIVWYKSAKKYVQNIADRSDIPLAVNSMLGDKKLEKIKNDIFIERLVRPITILAVSSLFTIDVTFFNTDGINILPHFIYGIILYWIGTHITSSAVSKKTLSLFTCLYSVFGSVAYIFTIIFANKYSFIDLKKDQAASQCYSYIEIFTLFETVSFLLLALILSKLMRSYIIENTGVSPRRRGYNRIERDYHKANVRRSYVLFGTSALIHLAKCLKVFLEANTNHIFSETGVIVTSALPWLGWAIVMLSCLFVIYSFIFLSGLKADVKFKYDIEEVETRRGAFE